VGSLAEAWEAVRDADEAFVIGGAQLYADALPQADRIYLTDLAGEVEGDTFFPALDARQWRETLLGEHPADERNRFALRFLLLERVCPPVAA
jgi:dihydrofolate reductase